MKKFTQRYQMCSTECSLLLETQVVPGASSKAAQCGLDTLSTQHTLRQGGGGRATGIGFRGNHGEVKGQVVADGKEWREGNL